MEYVYHVFRVLLPAANNKLWPHMQRGSALELNREGGVVSQRTQLKVTRARKCDVQMPDGINCHDLIKKLIDLSKEYTRFF